MGAGNRKESKQRQQGLSNYQEESGRFFMDQSKQELEQRRKIQAPVIERYTKLASGDPTEIMAASAVPLGNLAKATQQARANIMEMAPGAARTAALGQLGRESGGQQASFLNQSYLSAFPALQGLATESASTGLSAAGAGYRGVEGAATTNKGIMDTQQAEKASQLGLVGSLAGMAGSIATAGMMGGGKAGGGLSSAKSWSPSSIMQGSLSYAPALLAAPRNDIFSGGNLGPSVNSLIQPTGSNLFSGFQGAPIPYQFNRQPNILGL